MDCIKEESEVNISKIYSDYSTITDPSKQISHIKVENTENGNNETPFLHDRVHLYEFKSCDIKKKLLKESYPPATSEINSIEEKLNIKSEICTDRGESLSSTSGYIKKEYELYDFEIQPSAYDRPKLSECGWLNKIKLLQKKDYRKVIRKNRCPFCKKCFKSKQKRLKHQCRKYFEACCYCGEFFSCHLLFLNHFLVYHFLKTKKNNYLKKQILVREFQYEICLKKLYPYFQKYLKYNKRGLFKYNNKIKIFTRKPKSTINKCEICSKILSNKYSLKIHIKTHLKVCINKILGKDSLNQIPKNYIRKKRFKCEICTNTFSRKEHLNIHIRTHTGYKPFQCKFCTSKFVTKQSLKRHLRIHTGNKPFKCEICLNSFAEISNLKTHIRTHTGEKPYNCEICSKTFTRKDLLTSHIRSHTGEKPFKCDICGNLFSRRQHLKTHMRVHTGDKPYKCEICTNAFSTKQTLTRHMSIHTGIKPYKCEICLKSFTESCKLITHMRIHTGEKPIKCEFCTKKFSDKGYLKKHLKSHLTTSKI